MLKGKLKAVGGKIADRFRRKQQEQAAIQPKPLVRTTDSLFDPAERRQRRQEGKRQRTMRSRNSRLVGHRRHHPGQ